MLYVGSMSPLKNISTCQGYGGQIYHVWTAKTLIGLLIFFFQKFLMLVTIADSEDNM